MTTRTSTEALAVPAIKARLTRRDAISGAGAAALGLATGVASAAPAAHAQLARTALLDLARSIPVLAARCADLADKVATAEDAISFDLPSDSEAAEIERLGLPALRSRQDRALARLDRAAARLAGLPTRTPAELVAKSAAVVALLGTNQHAQLDLLDRHSQLVLSALRDAAALGTSA